MTTKIILTEEQLQELMDNVSEQLCASYDDASKVRAGKMLVFGFFAGLAFGVLLGLVLSG